MSVIVVGKYMVEIADYVDTKCRKCGTTGHLAAVCYSNKKPCS